MFVVCFVVWIAFVNRDKMHFWFLLGTWKVALRCLCTHNRIVYTIVIGTRNLKFKLFTHNCIIPINIMFTTSCKSFSPRKMFCWIILCQYRSLESKLLWLINHDCMYACYLNVLSFKRFQQNRYVLKSDVFVLT